jgi:hypothetical protein
VPWEEAERGFQAHVGSYVFRIYWLDEQGDITVTLRMIDDRGSEIFRVALTDDPTTLTKYRITVSALKELHELARRKALNVEQKVEDVSSVLDNM